MSLLAWPKQMPWKDFDFNFIYLPDLAPWHLVLSDKPKAPIP